MDRQSARFPPGWGGPTRPDQAPGVGPGRWAQLLAGHPEPHLGPRDPQAAWDLGARPSTNAPWAPAAPACGGEWPRATSCRRATTAPLPQRRRDCRDSYYYFRYKAALAAGRRDPPSRPGLLRSGREGARESTRLPPAPQRPPPGRADPLRRRRGERGAGRGDGSTAPAASRPCAPAGWRGPSCRARRPRARRARGVPRPAPRRRRSRTGSARCCRPAAGAPWAATWARGKGARPGTPGAAGRGFASNARIPHGLRWAAPAESPTAREGGMARFPPSEPSPRRPEPVLPSPQLPPALSSLYRGPAGKTGEGRRKKGPRHCARWLGDPCPALAH